MPTTNLPPQVLTVTLNPAIDQTVTIPRFTAGSVNRVEQARLNAAGKGVNVASALSDYGHRVAAAGFLGSDNDALFEDLFRRKNIADLFIRIPGQTRVGIKITDPERSETTDINFPGITPSAKNLEELRAQLRETTIDGQSWIVLAGSLPPGVDPGLYRDLIRMFRGQGKKVALDASGEALRLGLEGTPHIVKPNIHELEELIGRPLPDQAAAVEAARTFITRGTTLVVVSMGGDGALFVTADEVVMARPPTIEVRSTVGAGDAMVAGTIAGHLRNLPLAECARLATAFSLDALVRGESGITSQAVINAFVQEVSVQ